MTVKDATAAAASNPKLNIGFIEPGAAMSLELKYGRVTAWVRDGVVTDA